MQNFLRSPRLSRRAVLQAVISTGAAAMAVFALVGCGSGGGGGNGGGNNGNNGNNGSSNTVSGRVYNSTDADQPVEGATVVIGGKTTVTRTVDNANSDTPTGSFVLTDVPTGTEFAVVTPVGGAAQTIRFTPPVTSGANAGIELFINVGQISGRILLPGGAPASGAFVTIAATGDSTTTDTNGNFFFPIITPGPTQISAVLGTAAKSMDITVGVGNTDVGSITLVDDPNPNPPGIPNTIVGTISLETPGVPAPSTNVILFRNGSQIETTTTDGNGNYGFYVPVGNAYSVLATRPGFQNVQSGTLVVSNPSVPLRADLTLVSQ